jgi:hypothetical protein
MSEIVIEVKTHVILTHSGSTYFITGTQERKLVNVGRDDRINIDGNSIKGSSIAEVMTISKFYETYPEKRPAPKPANEFPALPPIDFRSDKLSRNGLAAMIRGIRRAVDEFRAEGKEPLKALELLAKAEKTFKEKYSTP